MLVVRKALGRSSNALCRSTRHTSRALLFPPTAYSTSTTASLISNLWSSKNLDSIRASCSALADRPKNGDLNSLSNNSASLQRIRLVLASLTESGQEEDMRHIETVLRDIYPILGLSSNRPDYMFVFQRLLDRGYYQQALAVLLAMKKPPGNLTPEPKQLNKLLGEWGKTASLSILQRSVGEFYDANPNLPNETFLILLDACFTAASREDTPLDFNEVSALVRWCIGKGMTSDPVISSSLYQAFAEAGDFDSANRIISVYESASRPDFDDSSKPPSKASSSPSSSASARALDMLANSTSYADILTVSESLHFSCQSQHYELVISNCIKSGKVEDAFDIYAKSMQSDVTPTAMMISPLIKSLYDGHYLDSSDEAIDRALEIYQHLADAHPPGKGDGPKPKLYYALIRMAISSPNTTKYLSTVEMLLSDMELRGYTDNSSFIAATQIIVEMRKAGSFSKVMPFYRELRGQLDQQGFIQILQEYCRLSFSGDLEVPLITEYFSIINHMRMHNVPLTPKVYTIILHQVGLLATKLRHSVLDPNLPRGGIYQRLVDTTRRTHQFLTLDASISPDAILWNQLMNTYQRLGLYRDMEQLWQMMYLSGRFDQITVNIMIDACGYSGNLRFVRSITAKLLKAGHGLDKRNWDTLVEALCRNHHFGEALEVMCVEMKNYNLEPQGETIRIFRKFGRKYGVWDLYKPSIANALPELWNSLPDRLKEI
jgi:pentatricopeptide repeat protein